MLFRSEERLSQVLRNLLSNAFKFTPEGRSITVRAHREGERVVLSVSDEGIGIPDDQIPRLFDRFYQVDGSSTRAFGGAGIGLNIVRHLTELMEATVEIRSREGLGTTVEVSLATHAAPEVAGATPSDSTAWLPFEGRQA